MARVPDQTLFAQAAAAVQARVRAHRAQIGYPASRMLEYLETNVFHSRFNITGWWRACGVNSDTVRREIQGLVGVTLSEYVRELRVETAMRLILLAEDLPLAQVGVLVGYEQWETFRGAFERCTGQRPTVYRERVGEARARGAEVPDPKWVRRDWLRKLAKGEIAAGETERLLAELASAAGLEPEAAPAEAAQSREGFERWLAAEWQAILQRLPLAERRRQLILGFELETPALCEHLFRQSREEGRDDPARGIAVAQLALQLAISLRPRLGEVAATHLEARAWACLGNAQRIALDWPAANKTFKIAEELLAEHPTPAALLAELFLLKSSLRTDERCLEEALELTEKALALCPAEKAVMRARILINRGNVFGRRLDAENAAGCFRAGFEALAGAEEPFLACTAANNLAISLCNAERLQEAASWLERAAPFAQKLGQQVPVFYQSWVGGLIAERLRRYVKADESLRCAREGFLATGRWDQAAVVALDLAHVAACRRDAVAVVSWVAEALPRLETLKLDQDGLAALRLLRNVLAERSVHRSIIERCRKHCGQIVGAPRL